MGSHHSIVTVCTLLDDQNCLWLQMLDSEFQYVLPFGCILLAEKRRFAKHDKFIKRPANSIGMHSARETFAIYDISSAFENKHILIIILLIYFCFT